MNTEDQANIEERPKAKIIISMGEDGAITPEIEGVSPFMVPTILRKVANLIEKQLISVP